MCGARSGGDSAGATATVHRQAGPLGYTALLLPGLAIPPLSGPAAPAPLSISLSLSMPPSSRESPQPPEGSLK